MNALELTTARALLRPFTAADADDAFACLSPGLTRWMAWEPPASTQAFAAIWRVWLETAERGEELHWVARERETRRFLGLIGAHRLNSARPELGIWLRQDIHGQRFGHELIGAVVAWVSRTYTIESIRYPVAEQNIASRRIAEAYGGEVVARHATAKYPQVVYRLPPHAT